MRAQAPNCPPNRGNSSTPPDAGLERDARPDAEAVTLWHDAHAQAVEWDLGGPESLAAILAVLDVGLAEFFKPFKQVVRPRTPRERG